MEILKTSPYLQIVHRTDGYAIFHSLFGRLSHIDSEIKDLLDTLKNPSSIDEILHLYTDYDRNELIALVDKLKALSFLVPECSDESTAVQDDMRFRELCISSGYLVRALQLIISNLCNFGCKFCFFKDHNSASRMKLAGREENNQMSFDTAALAIRNLLDLLRKHGTQTLAVEFFGGEPLMNWPVIRAVLEEFGHNEKSGPPYIDYSITTNGRAITPEMAAIFKKYDVTVTVSYNFPPHLTEAEQKNYPNYQRVMESLETLKSTGNALTFNTVLSVDALNYFDSKAYVEFCKQYNVQMIGLILDLNLDFYADSRNSNNAMDTIMQTYTYAKQSGIPVVGYWHEPFAQIAGQQALNFDSGFKCCPGEGCKLSVEPEGQVFVCKGCSETIGDITDLEKVFSNPKYKEYAFHAYRNAPACKGCMIENFCSTGCMGAIERHYKTINAVDERWCGVFRELTIRLINQMELKEFASNRFKFPKKIR